MKLAWYPYFQEKVFLSLFFLDALTPLDFLKPVYLPIKNLTRHPCLMSLISVHEVVGSQPTWTLSKLEQLMESLSQRREKTKCVTQCWSLLNVCEAPCSALRRRGKITNLFQLNISIQSVELFSGLVSSSAFTTLHISVPCFQFLRQKPWCHLYASPSHIFLIHH